MPMIRRRWYRPWIPCPRCWAHRQRGPWIPATSARPTSPLWNSAALNHTSRWDAKRITTIGRSIALHRLRLHRMTRAHWSKWPPNSERRSARPSIACANAPSNPCLASSKKCWAFANSPYAAGRPPPESGVWSVWPSISNDCMCCAPTERRVSLLEARKTSDGTPPADPNVQPLSERAAHSCPMSRSDPCRIFLSDRLLERLERGEQVIVNLRPATEDATEYVQFDQARVRRVLARIAADLDMLTRQGPETEPDSAEPFANPRTRHRQRLAEAEEQPQRGRTAKEQREALRKAFGLPHYDGDYAD